MKVSPFLTTPPSAIGNDRTDHDVVALELASVASVHTDECRSCSATTKLLSGALHDLQVVKADNALVFRFDDWLLEGLAQLCHPRGTSACVSWVPGSPIDCAAMIPTASPSFTGSPVARLRP